MPRFARLTRAEFSKLLAQKPHRGVGKYVSLSVYRPAWCTKGQKFGFVVPKKAISRAVDRNLIERRLREVIRAQVSQVPIGYVIILGVKKEARDATFDELRRDVKTLLERYLSKDTIRA